MIEIDEATERLYRSVVESPLHGPFIRRVDELCEEPEAPWRSDAVLAIVPGASYRENPRSGADGRLVREQAERIGCPTELVPLSTTGSLKENARILRDWLAAQPDRPVILASLSKGGPDIKTALAEPDAFRNVVAWVNLCGILDGTPVADWLLSNSPGPMLVRLFHRLRGQSTEFLRELRYRPGPPLLLPAHIQLISIVGFPRREHLTNRVARRCHARLAPLGPNDGGLILADVCALPGLLYPIWGADHYLRPKRDVRVLVRAILRYLGETLG